MTFTDVFTYVKQKQKWRRTQPIYAQMMNIVIISIILQSLISNEVGAWVVEKERSKNNAVKHLADISALLEESSSHLSFMRPEAQNNSEVEAQLGGKATLSCYTHYLGDHLVIWLKRDEERLLTAGKQVYSSDGRYSVSHVRHQKLWELTVRDVKKTDEGLYECQLTSHPPVSLFFWLKIIEARAVIRGRKTKHISEGSRLQLYCHVEDATETIFFVFWFHNGSIINYKTRNTSKITKHRLGSTLVISNVTRADSGTYRCEPYLAKSDNVTVSVINGSQGQPRNIFQTSTSNLRPNPSITFLMIVSLLNGRKGTIQEEHFLPTVL